MGAHDTGRARAAQPTEVQVLAPLYAKPEKTLQLVMPGGLYDPTDPDSDAVEPTKHLTERLPSQAIYFDRLARIQHELGRFHEEALAWEGVFRTSPTPVDACPMIATAYDRSSDSGRALDAYERCAGAEPQNPDLLLFLGRAYNAANRAQDAQRVLDQALAISPDYPDVHLLLGIRNFADGILRSARERFERFLALAPDRRDEVEVWIERTRQAPQ